jgi:hypothetical protein
VAVADGAGSAVLSRLGSRVAVAAAMRELTAPMPSEARLPQLLAAAAVAASEALEVTAAEHGVPLADLSTTLLLTVLSPGSQPTVACLQIGDGVIACRNGAAIQPLAGIDRGEYAGQTLFVSPTRVQQAELAARTKLHNLPAAQWLLVATDGVTDPYWETETTLHDPSSWEPIEAAISSAMTADDDDSAELCLAQWLDAFTPGHHDDRTLVLLLPPVAASEGPR